MSTDDKINFLQNTLQEKVKFFHKERLKNKFIAFSLKLLSTAAAGAITVLLGLKYNQKSDVIYSNIALCLGAIITLINAWDSFFGHKILWVRFTVTMTDLQILLDELNYAASGDQCELSTDVLDEYHSRMISIISRSNAEWEEYRRSEIKRKTKSD
jgi:hypothetical protein